NSNTASTRLSKLIPLLLRRYLCAARLPSLALHNAGGNIPKRRAPALRVLRSPEATPTPRRSLPLVPGNMQPNRHSILRDGVAPVQLTAETPSPVSCLPRCSSGLRPFCSDCFEPLPAHAPESPSNVQAGNPG